MAKAWCLFREKSTPTIDKTTIESARAPARDFISVRRSPVSSTARAERLPSTFCMCITVSYYRPKIPVFIFFSCFESGCAGITSWSSFFKYCLWFANCPLPDAYSLPMSHETLATSDSSHTKLDNLVWFEL